VTPLTLDLVDETGNGILGRSPLPPAYMFCRQKRLGKVSQSFRYDQLGQLGDRAFEADEAVDFGGGVVGLFGFLEDDTSGVSPRDGEVAEGDDGGKKREERSLSAGQSVWRRWLGTPSGPAAAKGLASNSADLASSSCSTGHDSSTSTAGQTEEEGGGVLAMQRGPRRD
jgi:hypothetical protein